MKKLLFILVLVALLFGCEKSQVNRVVKLIDEKTPTEVYEIFGEELFLKKDMTVCEGMTGECEALLEKSISAANKNGYTETVITHFTDDIFRKFLAKIKASPEYKGAHMATDTNKDKYINSGF